MKTGVIVLVHGSRGERATAEAPNTVARVVNGLKLFLSPEVPVIWASLQFNHPDLNEAAAQLAAGGAELVIVAPCFLFPGRHVSEDIPELVAALGAKYPRTRFAVADFLGLDGAMIEMLAERVTETARNLPGGIEERISSPQAIEDRSMEIIESLMPANAFSADERSIVKRVVHASGDVHVANLMKFSPDAVISGMKAIAGGSLIITDVRMAAAGIKKSFLQATGCRVMCALDAPQNGQNGHGESTRTAKAMYALKDSLNGAIIVIGNAPTALLAVIDMIQKGEIAPALVVGMPVGFVQAAESKARLAAGTAHYITIKGSRGGSPMAAAAVNALLGISTRLPTGSIEARVK